MENEPNNNVLTPIKKEEKLRTINELQEVEKLCMEYFNGDNIATDVWIKKYALKDSMGNLYEKTPVEMHHRLA